MKRSFLYLATAVFVGGALAACSSAGGGDLGDPLDNKPSNGGGKTPGTGTPGTETPGTGTPGTGTPGTETPGTGTPAPPKEGPGSATAAGRLYFASDVYPKISTACGACHASGAVGAPKFMGADVSASYIGMDGYGLIVTNSRFVLKGVHSNGGAPALTTEQTAAVTKWLQLEATDRAGVPAAVNTFEVLSKCIAANPADYAPVAAALETIRTQPRANENQNRCTGCRQAQCSTCHTERDQGFTSMDQNRSTVATELPVLIARDLDDTQFFPYSIAKTFIGLNGTALVATSKVAAKAEAVKTAPDYSHPLYTVPAAVTTAIETYQKALIAKFDAGQCPK